MIEPLQVINADDTIVLDHCAMSPLNVELFSIELNQLFLWKGAPFVILITTLLVFGLIGIGINVLFVYYIKNHADANRPINVMIAIQQV